MTGPASRRTFLQGLATAPLVAATTVPALAEPVTRHLLESYNEWLAFERRLLCEEMYSDASYAEAFIPVNTGASGYHFPMWPRRWQDQPQPSSRAAAVLGAVGCDWRAWYEPERF